jgi:hypothetical protein
MNIKLLSLTFLLFAVTAQLSATLNDKCSDVDISIVYNFLTNRTYFKNPEMYNLKIFPDSPNLYKEAKTKLTVNRKIYVQALKKCLPSDPGYSSIKNLVNN